MTNALYLLEPITSKPVLNFFVSYSNTTLNGLEETMDRAVDKKVSYISKGKKNGKKRKSSVRAGKR
jgi:hypothetical protein